LNAGVDKTIEIKTILGNHDNRNGGRKKFAEIIDQPPYQAFQVGVKDSDAGYVSFYMLDSSPRAFSKPQMAKLEEALKNDTNPKIFMTHYPLSSNDVSYYYLSLTDTEQRETMIKLMLENKVGLYLAGHRHQQMDPVTYSSSCHELTLASMNGLDTQFESPPTWYIMEVDTKYNMAKIYRCQWSDDGSADGKVTVDSAGMYSFAE
jgi:3',5'-cyclic AMP phosphodiesterase CpdA